MAVIYYILIIGIHVCSARQVYLASLRLVQYDRKRYCCDLQHIFDDPYDNHTIRYINGKPLYP